MNKTFVAPEKVIIPENHISIFLAGSIEMNKAKEWQVKLTEEIHANIDDIVVCNPRRTDWDSSWEQKLSNKNFYEQVKWEYDNITKCDIVFIYFQGDTKSPISLMELGLICDQTIRSVIVCCEKDFWRKGNVDFICREHDIKQIDSLDHAVNAINYLISEKFE